MDPANISPFVAYLCTELCPITGRAFFVVGGQVHLFQPWALIDKIETEGRWTVEDLELAAAHFADVPFQLGNPFGRDSTATARFVRGNGRHGDRFRVQREGRALAHPVHRGTGAVMVRPRRLMGR